MTAEEEAAAQNKFAFVAQPFPQAIRAIDCTYINILPPHVHEEAYLIIMAIIP